MSRRRLPSRRRPIATGINLTSLLDAIFNLVFFFLLATSIRRDEGQARVQLPASETAEAIATDQRVVSIDAQGRIFFEGREVDQVELAAELERLSQGGAREVTLRGDQEANLGQVYAVIDLCRKSGLDAVSLMAEKKP